MANTKRTLIASALMCACTSLALAAGPAANAEHDHNHADKKAAPPAATAVVQSSNAEFDAQIAHLRAIRERFSRANTPEERRALMDERMKVMQDMSASMRQGGAKPMKGKGKTDQMAMCEGMMDRHMAMMQEMMQMMMDGQSMGMGMGGGMSQGMGGMMQK